MHTVGRRTVDEVTVLSNLVDAYRGMQSQRIARTTVISIGRDDGNVGDLCKRLRQRAYAFGEIAVIVADQNFQDILCSNMRGALTILNVASTP